MAGLRRCGRAEGLGADCDNKKRAHKQPGQA